MSATLSVISSMATRLILADLAKAYMQTSGCRIRVESVGGIDAVKRIREGEAFDLAVLAADALSRLADDGLVITDSISVFARSPTAVAVRSGAARPQALDEMALRSVIADARSIGLSSGPSGTAVRALLQRWSMTETPSRRVVQAPPGTPVARLIAAGEVEIGFQQLSELLGEAGIDIVGAVPETLLPVTAFSAGICSCTRDVEHARALMAYMTSLEVDPVKRRHGMTPAGQ